MVERLSCTTCRIRKTKCDRVHPCTNCQQGGFECTFPTERRRPRDSRRQLAKRLEKIESKFSALAQVLASGKDDESGRTLGTHSRTDSTSELGRLSQSVGQLSISADQSRYSNNSLWASLSHEIAEMRDLLDDDNFHEENPEPAHESPQCKRRGETLVLPTTNLLPNPPSPELSFDQSRVLWAAYESNVAPLVKIFHLPSLNTLYHDLTWGHAHRNSRTKAVLGAVHFAAVVSMDSIDCENALNCPKAHLVHRYRCQAERAFGEAGLMNTSSVLVLQAFVLYLTSMRRCDDTWLVLNWTGLAVRIATSLGLHQDGTKLGLDSFAIEMRRRLWWHLMLLEADLSTGHGVDSLLYGLSSNTQMPSNLNDTDIQPGMVSIPKSRIGFTDMIPNLVRYEIMLSSHNILRRPDQSARDTINSNLEKKTKAIEELRQLLEERYLRYCSEAVPLQWATRQIAQMKCRMLYFSVCHVMRLHRAPTSSNPETQIVGDRLFSIAVDIVDSIYDLETNEETCHWEWYFRGDVQWPLLVYLLNEVIERPASPLVDHAWAVMKQARKHYHAGRLPEPQGTRGTRGMLFRPMKELTAKAFVVKEDVVLREEVHDNCVGTLAQAGQSNRGVDEGAGLQQLDRPITSDRRALDQRPADNELWSSDRLATFQNFWNSPELGFSTSSYTDFQMPPFITEEAFDNFLL
ncbi:hypothetical protein H2200_002023 [Cladophialophora chaetospira]|uniref:Zn(2)-C6 fungal-type domain-containing protein n=1 Tax=Cladophialophora chaetospira TaxID=386627 RepID=A0AA38XI43_9EURO|nr:hypothetical protein H2200_002023 [Cladophialophora chaetospira]